ncbi:winged helix-turn-helix domain-containing protein [Aquabacterium sp.]|uniref:winged helix-turn-helix domain-containing protein n=1 Tax=Aquabacterium sp. TaxID=1872578 RepID=UPI002BF38BD7|nr:winged helix-turn-helix domain-containing protein [Aquabacterium sp.]HSW08502.1 winged helix-turn-helix domain-containing protein [Aquabacterium sp.]
MLLSSSPSPAAVMPRTGRSLGLACDDPVAALPWRQALADEGLTLHDWPWHAGTTPGSERADALVLFLARGVTEQLARLRELAARRPDLPIVVVCRGLRELDHVLALEMGADDVIDAALGAAVAAARLRALWRRTRAVDASPAAPDALHFGRLSLLRRERCVSRQGLAIDLTEGEFELLWRLAVQAGEAVSRQVLLRELRGFCDEGPDRSIDSRVYRIRTKLGDRHGAPQRIRTIRNFGYLFSPMPD